MEKWKKQTASALLAAGFLLGVKEGGLALWIADDPQPVRVFSCRVSSLPPADQLMLRRGIVVQEQGELAGLLEDYL